MQTKLPRELLATDAGQRADAILRSCVHCGFCTATCPTYLLTGDERDGPRGRIYLIKSMLEGNPVSEHTQRHLDRCLTCRSCETTCPSGVQYHQLLDIGRAEVDRRVPRPIVSRWLRRLMLFWLPHRGRFRWLLRTGWLVRGVLPRSVQRKLPVRQRPQFTLPQPALQSEHHRSVLLLQGCVQDAATPNTNRALTRLLAEQNIATITVASAGCCGALSHHLGAVERARVQMRHNIDAWWPYIEAGAEALLVSASGCGAELKQYGRLLQDDPAYADKASRLAALVRDPSEWIEPTWLSTLSPSGGRGHRVAYHPPCTLQHGQRITGAPETLLEAAGYQLVPVRDSHLCCGSAGTYSLLQPSFSEALLERKTAALCAEKPDCIATANIGCQLHIASATSLPVYHWLELLADALPAEKRA
ncbi:glycolate oxidase subunit GlcF [Motiliproteus sediminis]|uniref:glycolate oxidase subunit GlcF n=1 Tax=Motiliproteus sediminis TaxID=1468178 RepID=UPI001AEF9CE1|nr:glycolate oxidase subunit GlcF [Motiliproteus sediminis]